MHFGARTRFAPSRGQRTNHYTMMTTRPAKNALHHVRNAVSIQNFVKNDEKTIIFRRKNGPGPRFTRPRAMFYTDSDRAGQGALSTGLRDKRVDFYMIYAH